MKSTVCHVCNHENPVKSRYCTQCGSKLKKEYDFACLYMFYGKENKNLFKLEQKKYTIGRNQTNAIVLDDSETSKNHAIIYYRDGYYWIEDLQSRNGVFVNGKKISEPKILYDEYLLKIGNTIFRFEAPDKLLQRG